MLSHLSGCRNANETANTPTVPIAPNPQTTISWSDIQSCRTQKPSKDISTPEELVLFYVGSSRDFRPPMGEDGFLIRIIPINAQSHSVPLTTPLKLILFAPSDAQTAPILEWDIPAKSLPTYWVNTRLLDGYLFRLDWDDNPVSPGRYIFAVMASPKSGSNQSRLCQTLMFENQRSYTTENIER